MHVVKIAPCMHDHIAVQGLTFMHACMLQAEAAPTLPDTVPGFEEMEFEHQVLSQKKKALEELEREIAECEAQAAEETTRCRMFEAAHDAYVTQVEKTRELKSELERLTEQVDRATEAACTSEGCSIETQEMLNRTAEDLIAEQERLMFRFRSAEQSERDKYAALQKARDEATDALKADKVAKNALPAEDQELLNQLDKQAQIRALRSEALEEMHASKEAEREAEQKKNEEELKRLAAQEEKDKAERLEALRKAQEREEALQKRKAEEEQKKIEEEKKRIEEEKKRIEEEKQRMEKKRIEEENRLKQEAALKKAKEEEDARKAAEADAARKAAEREEEKKKAAADAEIAKTLRAAAEKDKEEKLKAAEEARKALESKRLAQQLALKKAQEDVEKKMQELENLTKQQDLDRMHAEALAASEVASNQEEIMRKANIERDRRIQEDAAKVRLEREQEKARFRAEQERIKKGSESASPESVDENMVTQLMQNMNISREDAEGLVALQNMQKMNKKSFPPPESRTASGTTDGKSDIENAKRKIEEIEERTARAKKRLQMTKEREAEMKLRNGARALEEDSAADGMNGEATEGTSARPCWAHAC